jgi:hypothetical protein
MSDQTVIRHDIGEHGVLELRTVSGSVRIQGTDGTEAVVVARGDERALRDLSVVRGEGRLLVHPERVDAGLFKRSNVELDFQVSLPRDARVDIKAVSADITGQYLTGEQDYRTVSGDLRLHHVGGRMTAQAVSGDVRIDDGAKLELSATTTSGDVQVEAQTIEFLRVKTVSGDVRLTGRLSEGPRHTVQTVSGDLTVRSAGGLTLEPSRALDIGRSGRQPTVVGDGRAQLSFRSMSGDGRVTGPTAFDAPRPVRPMAPPSPVAPPAPFNPDEPTVASMAAYPWEPPVLPTKPTALPATRLDILRALERGEIDVEEAARRLEEVGVDA